MTALHELSIADAGRALRAGTLTSMALTQDALSRIAKLDAKLDSFILVTEERALAAAASADAAFSRGDDAGPMQGVPYALKDIYDVAGLPTTAHSKLRAGHVAAHDSVVASRLRQGGGVLLGKLATHEFALGGPSFDLPFPPARNPWNVDRIPGGSSSGSAAAIAAGFTRLALGSDTGGSIRGPAAYCGTVGLKPTYGLVSRLGVFPLSYALDHCGPLTWTVEDAAIAMEVIAGYDARDAGSADGPVPDFRRDLGRGVAGLKIGIPRQFFAQADHASPEVLAALDAAAERLAALGADVSDVTLPDYALFNLCGRVILCAEAFAIHEKDFRERPMDYGLLTWSRMALGAFLTAADITQAHRLRRRLAAAVNATLQTYDALITANALTPAPTFGAVAVGMPLNQPMQNIPFNVTGNPALSIPTGFSSEGLPLSMQIVGRAFDEPMVLRIGAALETDTQLFRKRPPLAS